MRRTCWASASMVIGVVAASVLVRAASAGRGSVVSAVDIVAAGVPKYLSDGGSPDYNAIFGELAGAGITVFLPTFQYREYPSPLSLGHEADFVPPCAFDDAAFVALRTHGVKLLVPGQLLYQPGNYPPLNDDPLAALIDCVGRGSIHGVFNIDEPVGAVGHPQDPHRDVRDLYERVKLIDQTLPVWMVHAPIPAYIEEGDGTFRPVTQAEIDGYLTDVAQFSAYADVVGFDLYPIPPEVAPITSPYQGGQVVSYDTAIPDYLVWLDEFLGVHAHFLVLQSFSHDDLWGSVGPPEPTGARQPTAEELHDMACLALAGGASQIAWWGQSFLTLEDVPLWEDVKTVSTSVRKSGTAACGAAFLRSPSGVLS